MTVLLCHTGGELSHCLTQIALGKVWRLLPTWVAGADAAVIANSTARRVTLLSRLCRDASLCSMVDAA